MDTADLLPGYTEPIQNSEEGYGIVDAFGSVMSMLPVSTVSTGQTVSATSMSGAPVTLSPTGSNPNMCPIVAIQWSGGCGSGMATSAHATISCPIGVNAVQASVSNNKVSFAPLSQSPITTITVTDFVVSSASTAATIQPGTPVLYTINVLSSPQGASHESCHSCLHFRTATWSNLFLFTYVGYTCFGFGATLTSVTAVSTLTIFTPNSTTAKSLHGLKNGTLDFSYVALTFPLLLAGYGSARRRSLKGRLFGFVVGLGFLSCVWLSGCGNHTSMEAATTYSITIAGTSNQLQHVATISLTIQ